MNTPGPNFRWDHDGITQPIDRKVSKGPAEKVEPVEQIEPPQFEINFFGFQDYEYKLEKFEEDIKTMSPWGVVDKFCRKYRIKRKIKKLHGEVIPEHTRVSVNGYGELVKTLVSARKTGVMHFQVIIPGILEDYYRGTSSKKVCKQVALDIHRRFHHLVNLPGALREKKESAKKVGEKK